MTIHTFTTSTTDGTPVTVRYSHSRAYPATLYDPGEPESIELLSVTPPDLSDGMMDELAAAAWEDWSGYVADMEDRRAEEMRERNYFD